MPSTIVQTMVRLNTARLLERLRAPESAIRQSLQLAGGTAAAQALGILTLPLLTRLYTPESFGQFGLFTAFTAVASNVVNARFEQAIPGAESDEQGIRLVHVAIAAAVPMTVLLVASLATIQHFNLMGFGALPLWAVWLSAPAVLALGLFGAARYWCVRRQDFGRLAQTTIAQGATRAFMPVALSVLNPGAGGLIASEISSRLIGVRWLFKALPPGMTAGSGAWRTASLKTTALRWKTFPMVLLPSTFIDAVTLALPLPLIARFYGPANAGVFFLVQRVAAAPAALVGASVADVFHARVGTHAGQAPESLPRLLSTTMRHLGILGLVILTPAVLLAPWAFPIAFGNAWAGAGWAFVITAPWNLAAWIVTPVTRILSVSAHMELKLVYDVLALVVLVSSVWFASVSHLTFLECLALVSAGQAGAYGAYGVLLHAAARGPRARQP